MALPLIPCTACDRHVRADGDRCPFCGAEVVLPPSRPARRWAGPVTRAAIFAGVTVFAAACGGDEDPSIAQPYGAVPDELLEPRQEDSEEPPPETESPANEPPAQQMQPMQPGDSQQGSEEGSGGEELPSGEDPPEAEGAEGAGGEEQAETPRDRPTRTPSGPSSPTPGLNDPSMHAAYGGAPTGDPFR